MRPKATKSISHDTPCSPRSTNLHSGPRHTLQDVLPVASEHGGITVVVVTVSIKTVVVRRNVVVVVVSVGAVVVVVGLLVGPSVVVTLCNGGSVVVVLVELDNPSAVVLLALLPSCAYVDVINSRININFIDILLGLFGISHMLSGCHVFNVV